MNYRETLQRMGIAVTVTEDYENVYIDVSADAPRPPTDWTSAAEVTQEDIDRAHADGVNGGELIRRAIERALVKRLQV